MEAGRMLLEFPTSQQGSVQYIDQDASISDSKLVSDVKIALKLYIEGDCDGYNELVTMLNHDPAHLRRAMMSHDPNQRRRGIEEVAVLVTCLNALSRAASCIHVGHHRSLIDSITGMRLWNYETDVMDALVELIVSLASICGQYEKCLLMLVNNFCPPSYFTKRNGPSGLKLKNQVLDRVHSTLNDIADLVPLSPMKLEEIVKGQLLTDSFLNADTEFMLMYVENMWRLENGALGGVVGETMLKGVVDVLVSLDLAIEIPERKRDMKFGESEEIWDDVEHDEIDEMMESRIPNKSGRKEIVMKLDNLLVLTFEHLQVCYKSHRLTQVFNILLQAFQTTVFPSYKPKFAQFVMFYACSLDPINCGEKFATVLLNIFIYDMDLSKRISVVACLASYLSRAKFMSEPFVVTMLESLAKWCSDYCKSLDGEINPEVHKGFYAGCQAIMYLLCFRMRSMVLNPRIKSQLNLLNLKEILMHPLSPLKVCMASIVKEFLHAVRETELFIVPETQEAFGGVDILDTFFLFDPCWLSKSSSLIEPDYMFWWMVESTPSDDDEETDNSSNDGIAEVRGDGGIDMVGGCRSFEAHSFDDEYGDAFVKMSITPKEYLLHNCATRNFHMQMPSKIRPSTSPE